jgi:AraC-like DNA-binding protein
VVIRSVDPDELAERLARLAPGVRIIAPRKAGFRTRVRGWRLPDTSVLTYAADSGIARFGEERGYLTVTVPLAAPIRASVGSRKEPVTPGEIHLIASDAAGEIEVRPGTHVLGLALDHSQVAAHHRAWRGDWDRPLPPLPTIVRATTARSRRFAAYLDDLLARLSAGVATLEAPRTSRGETDELFRLLIDAACSPESAPLPEPREEVAKRAEEFLAANTRSPIALSDLARDLETSVRTLSRAFHDRWGIGPVEFHRRRRLEAVRRDLFYTEAGGLNVTGVAMRYGFTHLGRFSHVYKRAFGEPPSQTLRH